MKYCPKCRYEVNQTGGTCPECFTNLPLESESPCMTAQHYEGKLKIDRFDKRQLRDMEDFFIAEVSSAKESHEFDVSTATELARRWNQHPAHRESIRELCEALSKINSLCLQGDSGEIHNDRAVEYIEDIARSTLAKHQPKDKKC